MKSSAELLEKYKMSDDDIDTMSLNAGPIVDEAKEEFVKDWPKARECAIKGAEQPKNMLLRAAIYLALALLDGLYKRLSK